MRKRELFAVLVLCALSPTIAAAPATWERIGPDLKISLPRDHGAHLSTHSEWWYLTGIVRSTAGKRLGFQITFFRRGLVPPPAGADESTLRARQAIAAHLAIADPEAGTFAHATRLRRSASGLARADDNDLAVAVAGWELVRTDGDVLRARARAVEKGIAAELTLRPVKPLVRHGLAGYSRKGPEPGNASAYLSWTRLEVSGTLEIAGSAMEVRGEAWFDHEWGSSQLAPNLVGWDWFGLRFSDGRELMLYRLRLEDGSASPYSAATLVAADGTTRSLTAESFSLVELDSWKSPHTGAVYPAGWRIRIPDEHLDLEVTPLLDDAEIQARGAGGTVYWEGPVGVRGSVTGEGYAELTGYAGSMAGLF